MNDFDRSTSYSCNSASKRRPSPCFPSPSRVSRARKSDPLLKLRHTEQNVENNLRGPETSTGRRSARRVATSVPSSPALNKQPRRNSLKISSIFSMQIYSRFNDGARLTVCKEVSRKSPTCWGGAVTDSRPHQIYRWALFFFIIR